MSRTLYVVTCVSNPVRYQTRYDLYRKFAQRMADTPNVVLYTTEMAFGDRPHEVTDANNPHHIQVRSSEELWHKENMLNLAIQRLPREAEYIAWIDSDIAFSRPDWAEETMEQLQHYSFVQMFSHAIDLGPRFEPMATHTGFVQHFYHNPEKANHGSYAEFYHPGYAWAGTRKALTSVGGLLDIGILGSGDRHMALAMIGKVEYSYNNNVHPNYKKMCQEWEIKCNKHIQRNIGYVDGLITHYWHGGKANRLYNDRWKILVNRKFDPLSDISRDSQGLWQLEDDKLDLRDDIRRYFRSRHEDCIFTGNYKLLP